MLNSDDGMEKTKVYKYFANRPRSGCPAVARIDENVGKILELTN